MSVQKARVTKIIDSEFAEVEMSLSPPTDHACCGGLQSASVIKVKARNCIGAAAGSMVKVEGGSAASMAPLMAALFLPVVLLIIGYTVLTPWGGLLGLAGIPIAWRLVRATAESRGARIVSLDNRYTPIN